MRTTAGLAAAVCLHVCALTLAHEIGLLLPITIVLGALGLSLVYTALRKEDTTLPYSSEPEYDHDRIRAAA